MTAADDNDPPGGLFVFRCPFDQIPGAKEWVENDGTATSNGVPPEVSSVLIERANRFLPTTPYFEPVRVSSQKLEMGRTVVLDTLTSEGELSSIVVWSLGAPVRVGMVRADCPSARFCIAEDEDEVPKCVFLKGEALREWRLTLTPYAQTT